MTMRLDIVTNDAGELVRREHARELGSGVVIAIYRLAKLAQVHDLANQAFVRQLEQTHQFIGDYCLRSGSNVNVLFAHGAIFVAGQLLKGSRGIYGAAQELGEILERLGGTELHIQRDLTREELNAFAEQISICHRTGAAYRSPTPKIRLRMVADAARLRGMQVEDLTPDERIVRTYASAVVIMRRFFEDLQASRYILPRRIKRIAQSIVDLSDAKAAAYLGVTEVRNANFDEAGRAVNTAILSVAIAREVTQDRAVLSQIAMAAMMHDVARPRALALAAAGGPALPGMAGPTTLSEDQEDRLAAGTAAVLTALGRVNEPTIARTVLTFEALWLRRQTWLGPVYWGARTPTLHSVMIAVARRYNDLLTPEPGLAPPTADYAVAVLSEELKDALDRTVLRMLVSALGLLPIGTMVQLSTGEVAEVVRGASRFGDKPRVAIVADANGARYPQPLEIELADDPRRTVTRVLGVDGWKKGLALGPMADAPPPDSDAHPGDLAPAAVPDRSGSVHAGASVPMGAHGESNSSGSLASLGSSPSGVAGAMGRVMESANPPPVDRTVVQPRSPDDDLAQRMTSPPVGRALTTDTDDATARGTLAATPLPHVLVYMLDHRLTGTVLFEGEGGGDAIYFVNGVPAKVRLLDEVAPLGQVLVDAEVLDGAALGPALEAAKNEGKLLGEYLVASQLVAAEMIAWALEAQLLQKIAHVANLAPEVTYSYRRDVDLLETWCGEIVLTAPLNPIMASVRSWNDRARVRATLNRIAKHPLVLHADIDLSNLALLPEEQIVLDAIRRDALPLADLFAQKLADDEVVSSLVYSLAVTRQFAFKGQNQKRGPMAARAGTAKVASEPPIPVAAQVAASAAVGAAPAAQHNPRASAVTNARSQAPGAASASAASIPAARPMTPAARPSGAMQRAPQIRPIGAKPAAKQVVVRRSTMVGIQESSPVETRASKPVSAVAPSAPPEDDFDVDSEDAKTIARVAPVVPRSIVNRPASAKPGPALPSKAASSGAPAVARGAPPAVQSTRGLPDLGDASDMEATARLDIAADRQRAEDELAGIDAGFDDAEAALDALESFRNAESAIARGDMKTALQYAEVAARGDAGQLDYRALLAWLQATNAGEPKQRDGGIGKLSKILIEDPSNERALLYRARLLAATSRLHEALDDYAELLTINPSHPEAQSESTELKTRVS